MTMAPKSILANQSLDTNRAPDSSELEHAIAPAAPKGNNYRHPKEASSCRQSASRTFLKTGGSAEVELMVGLAEVVRGRPDGRPSQPLVGGPARGLGGGWPRCRTQGARGGANNRADPQSINSNCRLREPQMASAAGATGPLTAPADWNSGVELAVQDSSRSRRPSGSGGHLVSQRSGTSDYGHEASSDSDDDNHSTCDLQDGILMRERSINRARASWSKLAASTMRRSSQITSNEPLLGGFALLRAVQLVNFDVHYINGKLPTSSKSGSVRKKTNDFEAAGNYDLEQATPEGRVRSCSTTNLTPITGSSGASTSKANVHGIREYRTVLDELREFNPVRRYIDKWFLLEAACQLLKICLSLAAIIISFSKLISTILLSVMSKIDSFQAGSFNRKTESSDSASMAVLVLILINLSSMYILCSVVFNGHLLWSLLSQRLFLVSRRFQYKTMMCLILFVYLEYFVNLSMINNLYDFSFGPELSSSLDGGSEVNKPTIPHVGSYYAMRDLRAFVTDHHDSNQTADILLTIFQFARGIIRISPYITINYAIICLKEHIYTIRNQQLLTDSLKRRQKLRLVVVSRRGATAKKKKRVIFATDSSGQTDQQRLSNGIGAGSGENQTDVRTIANVLRASGRAPKANVLATVNELDANRVSGQSSSRQAGEAAGEEPVIKPTTSPPPIINKGISLFETISGFDELESYITNLYIFTGRLNRLMSQQGLTIFFIVHNLTLSTALVIPEAIKGGPVMSFIVRCLLIFMGILPFVFGQALNGQLEQLSKQIDRIIIQQQFISRRRDNLVRIRELLHDIRVNCGGMLNFNIETGIKYLVIAFASAFFIEQEDYKLTRRQ